MATFDFAAINGDTHHFKTLTIMESERKRALVVGLYNIGTSEWTAGTMDGITYDGIRLSTGIADHARKKEK